jgi:hypothetical protein
VSDYARDVENKALRAVLSGWSISGILSAETGRAYTAKVGGDLNNDGNRFTDRVPGVERNTFTGPGFVSFDPRITREIRIRETARLQLIVEAFNVFNRANFTDIDTTFYSLTGTGASLALLKNNNFGIARSTLEPRIIQLAAKIIF